MPALLAATWRHALPAITRLAPAFARGEFSARDAAVRACMEVDDDPAVRTVGYGGYPNRDGDMELDASVMDGATLRFAAVAGLRDVRYPVAVARAVLENTPYSLIAGAGADAYAREIGVERKGMLSPEARAAYEEWRLSSATKPDRGHDTVCVIALDGEGHFEIAASTSGIKWKLPGRVSDTAMCGCGVYCDDAAGAAVATGVGEDIMRGCLSFGAVLLMEQGAGPKEAAEQILLRLARRAKVSEDVAVLCVDRKGGFAGAANHDRFEVSVCGTNISPKCVAVPLVKP